MNDWKKTAINNKKKYADFLNKTAAKKNIGDLPLLHREAFSKIDCLQCANCCKNHSPRFKIPDIKRIAKYLKIKEGDLVHQYLHLDSDNDYVLQQTPCPFLAADNYCNIYDVRPSDCSRYPYTDEDTFLKRKNITLKNTEVCPAAFFVMEKLIGNEPK